MSTSYYQFTGTNIPDLTPQQLAIPYFQKVHALLLAWKQGQPTFTIHSSGSTGAPKPTLLTRAQMVASAKATASAIALSPHSTVLIALHTELIAGFMMLVRTLENNWSATLVEPSSDPLKDIPSELVFDFVALTPMQLQTLCQKYEQPLIEKRLTKILLGGAPIDPILEKRLQSFHNVIYHSYGMTETVSHVAIRKVNGFDRSECYHLLDTVQAGVDERGCLYLQGSVTNHMLIQTNDLVEFQGEHSFKWIGRADNIINSGGIKIQLEKIDRIIGTIFDQCSYSNSYFSWHIPDQRLGQKLILVVENPFKMPFPEQFRSLLKTHLSKFEIPKMILEIEKFTKTPSGKIDKRATVNSIDNLSTHLINLR